MRAITGAVLSSKPCSLAKAARILALFADSAASHLPSSDAATYLRTATDATNDHHLFRRELRSYQQQGGDIYDTYEVEDSQGNKSGKKHRKHQHARDQDGERNADEEGGKRMIGSSRFPSVMETETEEVEAKGRSSKGKASGKIRREEEGDGRSGEGKASGKSRRIDDKAGKSAKEEEKMSKMDEEEEEMSEMEEEQMSKCLVY